MGVASYVGLFFRVYLIASVPGAHTGPSMHHWGHMKLRKVNEGTLGCGRSDSKVWLEVDWSFRCSVSMVPWHPEWIKTGQ